MDYRNNQSGYNPLIAEALTMELDKFNSIVELMVDEDWQYLYFYMGQYFTKNDEETLNLVKDLISKYLREDKLKRILKK